jgi:predicted acetyltransferase
MSTFNIYKQSKFPPAFKWQALGFMRLEWPSAFTGNRKLVTETYPPESEPVHFVAAEGDLLISYAAIIRMTLEHAGEAYKVYGLGNMLTFPSFRREGYGTQILELATEFIKRSDVDISILFCQPERKSFYGKPGWQVSRSPTRVGVPGRYRTDDSLRMMLFVSEKGRRDRKKFEEEPVYVDELW